MIDIETPESPGWWLNRCWAKLDKRKKRLDALFKRYEGDPDLPEWFEESPDAAKRFYKAARTSFAEMVVKAPLRRLRVVSIVTSASSSELGDAEAWKVWRRAGMLSAAKDIHRTMLIAGDAYAILGMDEDEQPYATAEDPRQVVTFHDPIRQERIRAGAKFFHDDITGVSYAYLYTPGRRFVARSRDSAVVTSTGETKQPRFDALSWEWDETKGGAQGQGWPPGMETFVGVVRYRNEEGVGEFERHEDILYRIDHIILQGMVIATMQAFRQRAIKVDPDDMPDTDPETGEKIDYDAILSADPGAMWKLPLTAELWESSQVDLSGILQMAEKEMQRLSAVTFTPLSMFNSDAVNQSAAGAELVKEGLTDKVAAIHDGCDQPHALVAAGLLRLAGYTDRIDDEVRVQWSPAVRFSLMEKSQAASAAKASGVPWRTTMSEFWQFTPEAIARMEGERQDDAILFPETNAAVPDVRSQIDQMRQGMGARDQAPPRSAPGTVGGGDAAGA